MPENNGFDALENIIANAHSICNHIMLFEALEMKEDEVRLFLDCNHVSDQKLQDTYLGLIREYDQMTSGGKTSNQHGWTRPAGHNEI